MRLSLAVAAILRLGAQVTAEYDRRGQADAAACLQPFTTAGG